MPRYVKVERHFLRCGKLLTEKGRREYCPDDPLCQADREAQHKKRMSDWIQAHKPWRQRNVVQRSYKHPDQPIRECQFCHRPTPNRSKACDDCKAARCGGLDDAYGNVL
jgi:hypothetical protein